MRFLKMHGAGNDYVFIDGFRGALPAELEALSVKVARPHFGVSSDGLIVIEPSAVADARMRMFNADGSESAMCGNGLRCVGKYLYDEGIVRSERLSVETGAGAKQLTLHVYDGVVDEVTVDMGAPVFTPDDIPVNAPGGDALSLRFRWGDTSLNFACLSMGNPHAVTFDLWPDDAQFATIAPFIERHQRFPQRVNVEFARLAGENRIQARVWERGSGETLACGSGACAVAVIASIRGLTGRRARIDLPGGSLAVDWRESDGHVLLTGPAVTVFRGELIV
jgi:diaminopimelate epimerase